METRYVPRLGRAVGVVGQGCWQFGGDWGEVGESQALSVLGAAVDAGVTFLDTADVYGDGQSERVVGTLLKQRGGAEAAGLTVATKMGRRADPHTPEAYSYDNFRAWTDRSRANLGQDTLQLVQLHCPPTPVYATDRVFDDLDRLVDAGAIAAYGVSVETVAEALTAIARPHVATVQIILNVFRRKPLEQVLPAAQAAGVGIIARVPLASGLLSGKYDRSTTFAPTDHRTYNRHGEAFDIGETFAGIPFEVGLEGAAEVARLAAARPEPVTTAQLALRWILDQPGVTTIIPGARNAEQAIGNASAAATAPLTKAEQGALKAVYDEYARPHAQDRW
jgi:aryl-alcohol dehydrogenase-like predicted oxidoreductase